MYLATEWALVSRMQRSVVLREAEHVGKIVCFCQAVDRVPSGITKTISEKLVQWPNATTLGRMVGLLGMPLQLRSLVFIRMARLRRTHGCPYIFCSRLHILGGTCARPTRELYRPIQAMAYRPERGLISHSLALGNPYGLPVGLEGPAPIG